MVMAVKEEGKGHKKEKKKRGNKKSETENAVEAIGREGDNIVRREDDTVESRSDAKKRTKEKDANNDRSEEKKKKKTGESDVTEDVMDKGGETTGKAEDVAVESKNVTKKGKRREAENKNGGDPGSIGKEAVIESGMVGINKEKKMKVKFDIDEKEHEDAINKGKKDGCIGTEDCKSIEEPSKKNLPGEANREMSSEMFNKEKDLEKEFELEHLENERKHKKRKKEKRHNKDKEKLVSSPTEIPIDEKIERDRDVEEHRSIGVEESAEVKEGTEGEKAKKTKKRKKNTKEKRDKSSDTEAQNRNRDLSENVIFEGKNDRGVRKTKNKAEVTDIPNNLELKRKPKRVKFSGHVEVFPPPDVTETGFEKQQDDLVRGKRFSKEEDALIKEAVANYIEERGLGEEGLDKILHCKSHPDIKNCWKEIGTALPWRPYVSIYYRAHILFERSEKRTWTQEECELVKRFHEQHGAEWKVLAAALGKHRVHVKDTWRRIKLPNVKKGHWSQEEYQTLFDLVNMDLRMKVSEEKKSKHGMLRDNVCWGAISDNLSTRSTAICCLKWYSQLTSPMVAEGKWADADDYRLLNALFSLDACCVEDVDWDNLLEHRSGDACLKRWNQMVNHLGDHGNKPFADQVEVLSKRYCPEMLEAREAYDSKPATS